MDSIKKQERIYFQELKTTLRNEVETKLHIRKEFKDWSGGDIQTFQIDLEEKCKSTVSEKWVYLHFKNENEKLPRLDVLNLLSQYCGFKNWDDFKFKNEVKKPSATAKKNKWMVIVVAGLLLLNLVFWLTSSSGESALIFKDAYTHEIINPQELQMKWQENGIKGLKINGNILSFKLAFTDTLLIKAPYYKFKKVDAKSATAGDTTVVELLPDDYALMLNYFSRAADDNWKKRRAQLNEAIHDEAKLFQVHPKLNGIEMLNKNEFIDRLILPINSLKNLEIQHIIYKDGQIYRLRFVQKTDEK